MLTGLPKFRFPALVLAAAISSVLLSSAVAASLKVGDAFPDLAAFKLEGSVPEVSKGKVVLVDFWASWCGPCKDSFPAMDELQKKYGAQGLVIIAVNVDENRADMDLFMKENKASFAVVRDSKQKLVEKTGIATMPSSFLLDRQGKIVFAHSGFHGKDTKTKYEQEIETVLKN